jgi:hypothetical protein
MYHIYSINIKNLSIIFFTDFIYVFFMIIRKNSLFSLKQLTKWYL